MEGQNKPQTKGLMRRRKGWIGFVRSYNNYIKNGSYDDLKWDSKLAKASSVTVDEMGKITYKF
jgi:hypothetical protein